MTVTPVCTKTLVAGDFWLLVTRYICLAWGYFARQTQVCSGGEWVVIVHSPYVTSKITSVAQYIYKQL